MALKELSKEVFIKNIQSQRVSEGKNILDVKFNKKRCRYISECEEIKEDSKGIIYWMSRESRVYDNWSFLYAQRLCLKFKTSLSVCFFLNDFKSLYPTTRHTNFLRKGLDYVKNDLEKLNIKFYLIKSSPTKLVDIVKDNNIGCIITDFFPLKQVTEWHKEIREGLQDDVVFMEVDSHNIVPCWEASPKQEIAARTIRNKIVKQLPEFLTEFPDLIKQEKSKELKLNELKLHDGKDNVEELDNVVWAQPGYEAAIETLRTFLTDRLKFYGVDSNDPSKNRQSNLSPWLHFGHIAAQRVAIEVKKLKSTYKEQCERYLEELIVRKEICDNFCFYNPNYDNLEGADQWAKTTLNLHRSDKRDYLYTDKQLEAGKTHDVIWNACQKQLVIEGKLHGYMRMYWCKKILEWTKSPEEAVKIGLWLNDKFSLDGSDPNGFVGVMWSICGIHDHGWKERPVFGKIRYMVDYSLRKKFDVDSYVTKYSRQPSIADFMKKVESKTVSQKTKSVDEGSKTVKKLKT